MPLAWASLRMLVFVLYLFGLLALPLLILLGWPGFLFSMLLGWLLVLWIRLTGHDSVCRRLGAVVLDSPPSYLSGALDELARRTRVLRPTLFLVLSSSINVGSFGFRRGAIVVTQGALHLPREELLALLAREFVDILSYRTSFGTWLSQFISVFGWVSGRKVQRSRITVKEFVREVVLWPLAIIPLWCLRWHVDAKALDVRAVALLRTSPTHLASVYRKLEVDSIRNPAVIGVSERHLFRVVPASDESLVRSLFPVEDIASRICHLERGSLPA